MGVACPFDSISFEEVARENDASSLMDVLSHALWGAAAAETLRRRTGGGGNVVWAAAALGVAPDLLSIAPVLGWATFQADGFAQLSAYVTAHPGAEPPVPPLVSLLAHHLHCIAHSVIVAGLVTIGVWWFGRGVLVALAGWWAHIVIDIPTHSSDYYAVPFLYPFTYWGFDGVAWKQPWVLAVNALLLAAVGGALYATRSPGRHAGR